MDTKSKRSFKEGYRRYVRDLSITLVTYAVVLVGRNLLLLGPMHSSQWHWASVGVSLLPLVPVCFMAGVVWRWQRSMDELMRRVQTESMAIAGGVTALAAVAYGLLENPPYFPFLSAWYSFSVFGVMWLAASIILLRRYAR